MNRLVTLLLLSALTFVLTTGATCAPNQPPPQPFQVPVGE